MNNVKVEALTTGRTTKGIHLNLINNVTVEALTTERTIDSETNGTPAEGSPQLW